ncbi:MAG: polyprenyl synthetase family protein [Desulfobacterales bacterium]|nr:polyprenyl synthetase family protein [Desulfobacterales bacterium]
MFELSIYLETRRVEIDRALQKFFEKGSMLEKAMRYSLMAGGKRVRPILCLAAFDAVNGDPAHFDMALNTACALEMIHTYSLIHDDLPAMDNDDVRRGKPTCHKAFNDATAILAGDALLTTAFEVLASESSLDGNTLFTQLEVIRAISRAAGFQGMIEGQMIDISSEKKILTSDELKNLHALKTGALIKVSLYTGAIIGNANKDQIENLCEYGANIGLAFQLADDILNIEGDPEVMGKAVGTDSALKKSTYPSILGIDKSRALAVKLIDSALHAIDNFDNKSDPLRSIARYIISRKK